MILHRNWWGRFPIPDMAHLLSLDKGLRLRIGVAEPFPFELVACLIFNGKLLCDELVLELRWSLDLDLLTLLRHFKDWHLVRFLFTIDFLSHDADSRSAGVPVYNFHVSHRPWADASGL